MLSSRLLQEKTFEKLIQEARNQIPLYSDEWTNYNPSDPAVTILENLSAFSILQQAYTDRISDKVQEKLFAMVGFERRRGRSARVLLSAANVEEPLLIPAGQRFLVGDLSFETNREFCLTGSRLTGLFGRADGKLTDYSYVLDKDIPLPAAVFTGEPAAGMEVYLVLDGMGAPGEDIIFHAQLADEYDRNEFAGNNLFAEIQWQCYTEKGFVNMRCRDNTGSFLASGEMRFRLPKEKPAIYKELPISGYVIRGVLVRADYDIPPKLSRLSGFLFEVWQKETRSICHTFGQAEELEVYCDLLEEGYVQIFCREDGEDFYRRYDDSRKGSGQGRCYEVQRLDFGRYRFRFDRKKYGYAPGAYDNAIKLVAYGEEMMRRFDLGQVYGYDGQEIALPAKNIVKESFSVIAERRLASGETVFDFVKPESGREEEFRYRLLEAEGTVIIEEAADFIDARLYLCGCATTRGKEGNLRAGSTFVPAGYESSVQFSNPSPGSGGRLLESLREVKERFVKDVNEHYTAVEAVDYEKLVRTTPELCIHKVKAVMDASRNQVSITVKPYSDQPFPVLSPLYEEAIMHRLEERRLLTTRIVLRQPVYVAVQLRGTIYVKPHYEGCREQIEAVLRQRLDYVGTGRNFGERLDFDELFHLVDNLECVDFIYELSAIPQNSLLAVQQGLDIKPADNCLLYPGDMLLELNTLE